MPIRDTNSFPIRLKHHLIDHNLKNQDFAEKMGVSKGTVSLWLSGKRTPSEANINSMCEVLDLSYMELFYTKEEIARDDLGPFFRRYKYEFEDFHDIADLAEEMMLHFKLVVEKYRVKKLL